MTVLRSPNELMEFSKKAMLNGREPVTLEDWVLIVNCLAANLHPESAQPAMKVIKMIYDIPLSMETINKIVAFQISRR